MKLYLLKRDHHEGQDIYGVYDSEMEAYSKLTELKEMYRYIPESDYYLKELTLNELNFIEAYDQD